MTSKQWYEYLIEDVNMQTVDQEGRQGCGGQHLRVTNNAGASNWNAFQEVHRSVPHQIGA